LSPAQLVEAFPLSWTHYIHLIRRSRSPEALKFYEAEALRGGWSVRQLDRQMATLFYERVALSKQKAEMLTKSGKFPPEQRANAAEEIKDPFVLEFLGLKDEYSESDLEDALIHHLEHFLLETGWRLCVHRPAKSRAMRGSAGRYGPAEYGYWFHPKL